MAKIFSKLIKATRYGTREIFEFIFKLTPDSPKDIQVVQITVTIALKKIREINVIEKKREMFLPQSNSKFTFHEFDSFTRKINVKK